MYLDFFGFKENPFSVTPNPHFIFFSKIHKEAFALLLYGLNKRFGFIELLGEVGTGKTTVIRTLLSQLGEQDYRLALIFNPKLSSVDLMRAINCEYGIRANSNNCAELLEVLNSFLLHEHASGRIVVLVIDEAQNLSVDVLEQIRLISNLETETQKLIQIVLAGQPELASLLEKPELRQLNQRIALRYKLKPLDWEDTINYIKHRLEIAGDKGTIFSRWAVWWIYKCSRGTPRLINILCDRALLIAFTENRSNISGKIVGWAYKDVMLKPVSSLFPVKLLGCIAVIIFLLLTLLIGYSYLPASKSPEASSPQAILSVTGNNSKPIPQTVPTFPTSTPQYISKITIDEIDEIDEIKSAENAFNSITKSLHSPQATSFNENISVIKQLKQLSAKRKLEITSFTGTLDELVNLDSPALLLLKSGKKPSIVIVALTGATKGKYRISPSIAARNILN